ncbi:sulfite exporter TauE/SafE family protein [Amphritea balenae]|nr:sulfite exporter TauE/SafE family protein [Amphritea balenae]GGK83283.1 hypothetical protein GCM10007941_37290 [Amphritea balenae]
MSPIEWLLLGLVVMVAGLVRGCIGFGFSSLVVVSATLFLEPVLVVPMLAMLEIVASAQMIIHSWRDTAWSVLWPLLGGTLIATPVGVMLLVILEPDIVRLLISVMVLILSLLLFSGWQYKGSSGVKTLAVLGMGSGICNGTAAVGGLPVAVFLTATNIEIRTLRATLVMFFLATDIILLMSSAGHGLVNKALLLQSLVMVLPMLCGIFIGSHLFERLPEQLLRRCVIGMLMLLSITGIMLALM